MSKAPARGRHHLWTATIAIAAVLTTTTGSAVAATGGIFRLGRSNAAGVPTSLSNTGKGPALILRTHKLTTPPLSVGKNHSRVTNLNADFLDGLTSGQFQRRVSGTCTAGRTIAGILASGAVTCGGPDLSPYQKRVAGTCTGTNAVQSVGADGTVTCSDTSTLQKRVTGACSGTTSMQSVGADGTVTCGNDTSGLQARVTGACSGSTSVQAINADGSVTCSGTSRFAVVNSDGSLARASASVLGVANPSAGVYTVQFNSDISGCAYVADPGLSGSSGFQGASFATVVRSTGTADTVRIRTFDSNANATNEPFHLIVLC